MNPREFQKAVLETVGDDWDAYVLTHKLRSDVLRVYHKKSYIEIDVRLDLAEKDPKKTIETVLENVRDIEKMREVKKQ